MGRVSELTTVGRPSSAHLDSCPVPVPVKNEAVMVLHLEDEESRGSDKDAVDVGDPSTAVHRDVVIGGILVTQF